MIETAFLKFLGAPFVADIFKSLMSLGYKRLRDKNEILKFLADYGIEDLKDENRSLYIHTLILLSAQTNNSDYYQVLVREDAFSVFKTSYIKSKDKEPFIFYINNELEREIAANGREPDMEDLTRRILKDFFAIYDSLLIQVASPVQNSILDGISKLGESGNLILQKLETLNDDTPLVRDQIEFANNYMSDRNFTKAIEALKVLEKNITLIKTAELRSTLLTNIGYSYYEIGDRQESRKYFKKAFDEDNHNFAALCNYSQGLVAEGNLKLAEELIDKAVALYGADKVEIWDAYIVVKRHNYDVLEIIEKIPKNILEEPNITRLLAITYRLQGNYNEYFSMIRLAYERGPKVDSVRLSFIESEIFRYQTDYKIFNLRSIGEVTKLEIEMYLDLTSEMLDLEIENTDTRLFYFQAKLVLLYLLRREQEALDFYNSLETAFALDRHKLYRIVAMLLFVTGKFNQASEILEKYIAIYKDSDDMMMLFEISSHHDDVYEMERCYAKLTLDPDDTIRHQALYILIERYKRENDREKLERWKDDIKNNSGLNYRVLEARILHFLEAPEFISLLIDCSEDVNEETPVNVLVEIIELFELAEMWGKAVEFLEKTSPLSDYEYLTDRYLSAIEKSGDTKKLVSKLASLRTERGVHSIHSIKEFGLLIENYLLNDAIALGKDFLKTFEKRIDVEMQVVLLQLKIGDFASVDLFLEKEMNWRLLKDADLNNYLVLLALRKKQPKCIELLYNIHRERNTAFSNDLYLSLWFKFGFFPTIQQPSLVGKDTVVVIYDGVREERILVIVDEDAEGVIVHRNEVSLNDSVVALMIDQNIDFEFELDDEMFPKKWKIKSIESKYTYQFRVCQKDAGGIFKRDGHVKSFHVDDLIDMIKSKANIDPIKEDPYDQILAFYKRVEVGLGTLSEVCKMDLIETRNLIIRKKYNILTSLGVYQELEMMVLEFSDQPIVFDLTGIMTLQHLRLLDIVGQNFKDLRITQSSYDILYESFQKGNFGEMTSSPAEDTVIGILDKYFLIQNPDTLSLNKIEKEQAYKAIGKSIYDSALLTKENNCLFFCDDLFARNHCSEQLKIKATWIVPLLKYLKYNNVINDDLYQQKVLELLDLKYSFIDINSQTLLYCFEKDNFKITARLLGLFAFLSGDVSNMKSAVSTALDFLHNLIQLNYAKNDGFLDLVNLLMSHLSNNREINPLMNELELQIETKYVSSQYKTFVYVVINWFWRQYGVKM